ncbi:hypothetical protein OH76DRAFT_1423819 [Lentinus brumalis]|uniref:Uncharacterized protein n=1 Tax=Lentinus brumalis TaxID=2498619 RepID=A0A371CIY7_9APHY|nr:hypothetical protein OH76DRAFT_1423819 [Polyporus brumalis]
MWHLTGNIHHPALQSVQQSDAAGHARGYVDLAENVLRMKEVGEGSGPRDKATAHFVGQAVAAFRYASDQRRAASEEELASATFVGISMMKTAPVFHKIRVTRQLLDAVQDPGAALETATTVERFTPNSTSASPPGGTGGQGRVPQIPLPVLRSVQAAGGTSQAGCRSGSWGWLLMCCVNVNAETDCSSSCAGLQR